MINTASALGNRVILQPPVIPTAQKACTVAIIIAMASSTGISDVPMAWQHSELNSCPYFSTNTADTIGYTKGSINLWWDGDSVMSSEKANNLLRLVEIEQLQNNWNGNNASSFSEQLLSTARQIIMKSLIQGNIFPTARDSIQFEYENNIGDYLEIEAFENGRIKMFSFTHDGTPTTEDIAIEDINEVVSEFYGRNI